MREHLLSVVLAVPALGVLACLLVPRQRPDLVRWVSMAVGVIGLGLMVPLWRWFERGTADYQFVEEHAWIPQIGASWRLGIDGIALLLILLTLLVLPLVLLFSWNTVKDRVKEYHVFLLVLQCGMLGVFMALDVFLFFVFWEVMLVPMYFLIGIWGSENRRYASIKFFLYTAAGSALMLLALLKLAWENDHSFDLRTMPGLSLDPSTQAWVFLGLFLGFAIKVPLFPLHTWLPDAHGQAPTAGSVVLAAVLLKMGTYGFVRFAIPILPEATVQWAPVLLLLCVVGIIYGALTAMAQSDMKQLVAYSSVSHLGFVMLGVFCLNPNGLSGGLLQMINHGLSTGALFLLVGMLYERRHTKQIGEFGGIAKVMPLYSAIFLIITMSSIGLPGLNGFVGEFTILAGTVELAIGSWSRLVVLVLAATGIVLGAVYMLWMVKRVFFGPLTNEKNRDLVDVRPFGLEFWSLAPLVALCFWIGLYPKPFFEILDAPVRRLVAAARPGYYEAAEAVAEVTPQPAAHGAASRH